MAAAEPLQPRAVSKQRSLNLSNEAQVTALVVGPDTSSTVKKTVEDVLLHKYLNGSILSS